MRVDLFTQNLLNTLDASRVPVGRYRGRSLKVLLISGLTLAAFAIVSIAGPSSARSTRSPKGVLNSHQQARPLLPNRVSVSDEAPGVNPAHRPQRNHPHAQQPTDISLNYWTNLYPQLFGVSAIGDGEAWAVGEYGHLTHYIGGSWSDVDPQNMRGLDLTDINMLSQNSGWIAAGSKAFQYDGANWTDRSTGLGSGIYLDRISALSANNVWGVTTQCGPDCTPSILHWDGSKWNVQVITGTISPVDISMVSATNGWVLNYDSATFSNDLLHYDGANWTRVPIPPDPDTELDDLYGITTTPNGDVWIAADVFTFGDSFYQGRIYRYTVGNWTHWDTPDHSVPYDIYMRDSTHGWAATENGIVRWDGSGWTVDYSGRYLAGVSGASGQLWAVGAADTIVVHTNIGSWILQSGGPTTADLYAASALDSNDVWAVGGSVTRGGGLSNGAYNTVIMHYNGAWQIVPTTFTNTIFYNVKMLSPTEGYAVGLSDSGSSGIIARWDGVTWTQVATPTHTLRGIAMLDSGEGWAVGSYGTIWRDRNGVWSEVLSPVTHTLYSVALDSRSHGWAAGGDCCTDDRQSLIEYVGSVPTGTITGWVDRTSLLPAGLPLLRDLTLAPGGNEGWLVGSKQNDNMDVRPILHLDQGTWSLDPYNNASTLNNVEPGASGEYWAVGDCIHHYTGGVWHRVDCPASYPLLGLAMTSNNRGWAVGGSGEIVRYAPPSPTPTITPPPLPTPPLATATSTLIPMTFRDVQPTDYFYEAVRVLFGRGIISGYSDNTFRPNDSTTRAQLCKIIVLARGWPIDTSGGPHFTDMPPGSTFYSFIETAYHRNIISGYNDRTFRPGDNVTRAQLSKIVVLAMGWQPDASTTQHFRDVPVTAPLYGFVETAYKHQIISGYNCGAGCLEFRPGNDASRGQIVKIVYLAITSR